MPAACGAELSGVRRERERKGGGRVKARILAKCEMKMCHRVGRVSTMR